MRSASEEDAKEHEDWTDLESDLVQKGRRTPGEDDDQEDPVIKGLRDDVDRGLDDAGHEGRERCRWTRRWCARRRSEREHDHKQKC